ncbi:SGNH/GDSL hydrolase family protein [Spirosoma rigui]|uniref:SGNH/GDSL hydrolase family protein n=1 Tax=Spirosoma rigui TaxID=564064 RepID=UPI0009B14A87|nr:SGNH/GDSL hydrolase family protein [Spirosoma rigui]
MKSVIEILSNSTNEWGPGSASAHWLAGGSVATWIGVSGLLLLVLAVCVNRNTLKLGRLQPIRASYALACLILIGFCPLGCGPIDTLEDASAARQAAGSGCDQPDCLPLAPTRVPKGVPPPPAPQGLPVPTFSPQSGTLAFGTGISLGVTTLPVGAVIEYSYDDGKTWIPGDKAPILGVQPILSRTRINDLTSSPSQASFTPFYKRMMVIGNSIMNHGPLPAQGWFNSNGMAASAPEKDYVHLLTARLAQQYPQVTMRLVSGGDFERQFGKPDYSIDEFNEPLQQFKPDLIIVRLGENVDEGDVLSPRNFEAQYRKLLERLATYTGQPVKIVCTTSVWKRTQTDIVIRRVATEKGITLVDLSSMVGQDQFFAFNEYKDAAIGAHPNDNGMKRIADLIWAKLP